MSSFGQSADFWDEMPRQSFVCSAEGGRHKVTDRSERVLPESEIHASVNIPLKNTLTVIVFLKHSYLILSLKYYRKSHFRAGTCM